MNKLLARSFPALFTGLLGGVCLAVVCITLYVLSVSHWHGPFRDMWEIYPFLEKVIQHSWGWDDLWESYGYAHRLFIPRLLFVADYQFADASNHLLIGVSLLCQAGIIALFARILFVQYSIPLWQRGCLLLLVIICQLSGTLLFNLMHTFDVQWFLCCFLVTAAFYILTVKTPAQGVIWLAVSGVFIVLACLCNFSAMAAWPVWMCVVYFRMASLVQRGIFFLAALVFMAIYATGIRSVGLDVIAYGNIPLTITYFLLQFPLLYLANPLSDPDYLPFGIWAIVLVIIPLLLLLRFGWDFFKANKNRLDQSALFLPALMLFGFGVAVMTGLGRGYDPGHVQASRYQNIVMLFWSAAIPFVFLAAQSLSPVARLFLRASGILFITGLITCQWQSWNENLLLGRNVSRSHLALMMGYSDDVPMISATVSRSMIYVPGYNLEKERQLHEQSRKGIYDGSMAQDWLNGAHVSEISVLCKGVEWKLVDRKTPYTSFVEFQVTGDVAAYDYALLVDESGRVVALAEPERAMDLKQVMRRLLKLSPVSLRGFSRTPHAENLSLVMISPHHNRCSKPFISKGTHS